MMKQFLVAIFLMVGFASCISNPNADAENALAKNEEDIAAYAKTKGLTTTRTASGLVYQIAKPNTSGANSAVGNLVTIHYKLFLLNGTGIDSSSRLLNKPATTVYGAGVNLSGLEEALSFLKSGERATLLMNNTLAFGSQSSATIPAYSALGIDIEILKTRTEEQQIDDYVADKKLTLTEKSASGLRFIRTATTTNPLVTSGQTVTVKYAGRRLNDVEFDAGQFNVAVGSGGVIKGFDEGISKLRIGEKATIIFPSGIGYGAKGSGNTIPPYSPLIFDIEIVK